MKWNNEQRRTEPFSFDYRRKGRKKGYRATITYSPNGMGGYNPFYFLIENNDSSYNSLWDKKSYKTEEECLSACEKWIDEH